ncbi:MAG: phosphatase [Candidatus Yanofskybacteria bacterium RIFCSPHIGHO2_02_FULL_44_12b]|uniref:Phosphatase n=2 Tax=Candidatus Yanofskyibacteriota TaxID=1752733 RepID=A0A1F8GQ46_9BACT|nr:MAG: Low specificity phosphatase (HAD superfamily)-like protein [Candidatus Yanofskybacteria bacterium GW2011_GWA2_44_9]OGN04614.1 MAG: phosphatase [Candidatus Yanofskybacteria bacterium RIFCSPHIGHO2_01_FULL_44_24]OGN15720.1 MAG: phosphatase [Candidatus Yanofskybacteria bacterium RIFCSPHIGHO2_02_FULL_44_12b]OGN26776.1 MAG: phosphatase [Candidatus Yanofskybacteria bacterium RIFCSPLOWO2_01_FULL_44_22]
MGNKNEKPKNFIIDVDGVLTDGQYYYTDKGKVMKVFGPDDHDALLLIKPHLNICMISGDKRGFEITRKRIVSDMRFPLWLVSTFERVEWIKRKFNPEQTIYMGDGIFDGSVFDEVAYGIAPANAFYKIKERADFVTFSRGGDSAVAEACLHIMEKFFKPIDLKNIKINEAGVWRKKKQ